MCGIVGLWLRAPIDAGALAARVGAANDSLAHRGPDARAVALRPDGPRATLGLGHRRLAIVDLSPEGVQPMASATGRYLVCFNGEVYNHAELRAELERAGRAPKWRGHSDTEVMLAAFEAWGVEASIDRFVGMFALALWDEAERKLHLVRDRLGIKPLFVAHLEGGMAFASEVRAFETDRSFDRALSEAAIEDVLSVGYVGIGRSIYRAVHAIEPGTHVVFDAPQADGGRPRVFWDVASMVKRAAADPFRGDERDAVDAVDAALRDSVRLRMLADVSVGAFLSGGIDSSVVTALMAAQASSTVRTYSIGNVTSAYDESTDADAVARHLGTRHTAFRVTEDEAKAVVPELATMYDEPFADSSQIPTYLVCKLARREVTVALSGDGGDEVFGGYNRHVFAPRLWRALSRIPRSVRSGLGRALAAPSEAHWDAFASRVGLDRVLRVPGQKAHKLGRALAAKSDADFYDALRITWAGALPLLRPLVGASLRGIQAASFAERMMATDLVEYLPGDILTKVDRASMAVALEARVPLLDHRVVELAWRLPMALKVRGRVGKYVLRSVLARYVPRAMFERPKMGFGVPLGQWLRGELGGWAASVLDAAPASLSLDRARLVAMLTEHRARGGLEHQLWPAISLCAWAQARNVR